MRCGYILLINDIENVVTESKNDNVVTLSLIMWLHDEKK